MEFVVQLLCISGSIHSVESLTSGKVQQICHRAEWRSGGGCFDFVSFSMIEKMNVYESGLFGIYIVITH